jgi:hypothetical protein
MDNLDNIKYITHTMGPNGELIKHVVYNDQEISVGHKVLPPPSKDV